MMKALKIFAVFVIVAMAAAGGWYVGRGTYSNDTGRHSTVGKILHYQCPMHPWIKSDHPGNCTICGMKLSPVHEGEKGGNAASNLVTLTESAISVLNVQTEAVDERAIKRTLEVAGRIETDETRQRVISAYVDGRIDKLYVNYGGAEVREGEPLALLYSPELVTAERDYISLITDTNLSSTPGVGGQQEQLARGARERLRRLGLTDGQISSLRPGGATNVNTQIVAPIGGTVLERFVLEGQYVKEGDKLFELADLSTMWFRFDVYEQDLPGIQPGEMVRVTSPALGGKTLEGPIIFIDPSLNEATRSARVRVELDNPSDTLAGKSARPLYNGLYASGRITLKTEPVLTVSRGAVLDPGDAPRVYVDRGGGAYEQRFVILGRRGENYIEVLSGLERGEKVVINGNLLIDSQAQIRSGHSHHPGRPAPSHQHETTLVPEQIDSINGLLHSIDPLSQALASDDLEKFNANVKGPAKEADALAASLSRTPFESKAQAILLAATLDTAKDLAAARAEFLPLSIGVSDLLAVLHQEGVAVPGKVYQCPMYPKAGKTALWVQLEGPLRNPFFGSKMIDCGSEVKP